jgi:hypothetical protein
MLIAKSRCNTICAFERAKGAEETDVRQTLTGVGVILLVIGDQQSIALAGNGLIGEVLILDLGKLDHFGGCELGRKRVGELVDDI